MSWCCNGLQALIKAKIGIHVVYVHCYAHTLNLALSESIGTFPSMLSVSSTTLRSCVFCSVGHKKCTSYLSQLKEWETLSSVSKSPGYGLRECKRILSESIPLPFWFHKAGALNYCWEWIIWSRPMSNGTRASLIISDEANCYSGVPFSANLCGDCAP